MSTTVNTALYQYAQLTNPSFNGVVAMQGLQIYGIAGASPTLDVGMVQHRNRLTFAISSANTTPSDLGNKIHHRFNRYVFEN